MQLLGKPNNITRSFIWDTTKSRQHLRNHITGSWGSYHQTRTLITVRTGSCHIISAQGQTADDFGVAAQVVMPWHIRGEALHVYYFINGFLAISPSHWSDGISLIASEIVCIRGLYFRVGMWHHKTFFMENGELSVWSRELLLCRKNPWVNSSGRWRRGHWGSASGGRTTHTVPSTDTSVRVQVGQAHFPCLQR